MEEEHMDYVPNNTEKNTEHVKPMFYPEIPDGIGKYIVDIPEMDNMVKSNIILERGTPR